MEAEERTCVHSDGMRGAAQRKSPRLAARRLTSLCQGQKEREDGPWTMSTDVFALACMIKYF